jgi:hypothetical protein
MSCTSNCTGCTTCINNTNTTCNGCPQQVGSQCVVYNGELLSCISVTAGLDLETILGLINSAICAIDPATSQLTIVDSANTNNVTVTSTTLGTTTTYHVDVSNVLLMRITSIESSITTINSTLLDLPINIVNNTPAYLTINHPIPNRWEFSYIGPMPNNGGVVYADNVKLSRPVSTGVAVAKTFTANYTTAYALAVGNVIKVKGTFQVPSSTIPTSRSCKISVGGGVLDLEYVAPIGAGSSNVYSVDFDLQIHVVSATPLAANNAVIRGTVLSTFSDNSLGFDSDYVFSPNNLVSPNLQPIAHTMNNYCSLDWSSLAIDASLSGSTVTIDSQANIFSIELVKLI